MTCRRVQVLRTKGPAGDMLPANGPPTNGKASHKRKAPAALDSPATPPADASAREAKESQPAAVNKEAAPPAKRQASAKRQNAAKKAPKKRGKAAAGGQAVPQLLQESPEAAPPEGGASQAVDDGLPDTKPLVVPTTDAGSAQARAISAALPNGHVMDVQPASALLVAATGPGEGVPPAAALPCKKKGGWPKGKPRRNHVPTGKVPT